MQKTGIAICGNGKLSKKIQKGLIDSRWCDKKDIFVVPKDYSVKLSEMEDFWENPSPEENLKNYEYIILAVRPDNAVDLLLSLRGRLSRNVTIISFVSGLSTEVIRRITLVAYDRIIVATTNTNLAYGSGVIFFKAISSEAIFTMQKIFLKLAHPMGIIPVAAKDVIKGVTLLGSMAAYDCTFFEKLYLERGGDVAFNVFMKEISLKDKEVKEYTKVKEIAYSKVFGWSSIDTVKVTLESTLQAIQSNFITLGDLQNHTKSVVTPNGCTEKGIGKFKTFNDTKSITVWINVLSRTHRTVKFFAKSINKDFKKKFYK